MPQKGADASLKRAMTKSSITVSTAVKKKKVIKDENFPRGGSVKTELGIDHASVESVANPEANLFKVFDIFFIDK